MKPAKSDPNAKALAKAALALEGVEEGVACKGTVLESTTFGVKKKNFLFLGVKDEVFTVRLKLGPSRGEAQKLAKQAPGRFEVGTGGWSKITFRVDEKAPLEVLGRWIGESYRAVVPKIEKKR